ERHRGGGHHEHALAARARCVLGLGPIRRGQHGEEGDEDGEPLHRATTPTASATTTTVTATIAARPLPVAPSRPSAAPRCRPATMKGAATTASIAWPARAATPPIVARRS